MCRNRTVEKKNWKSNSTFFSRFCLHDFSVSERVTHVKTNRRSLKTQTFDGFLGRRKKFFILIVTKHPSEFHLNSSTSTRFMFCFVYWITAPKECSVFITISRKADMFWRGGRRRVSLSFYRLFVLKNHENFITLHDRVEISKGKIWKSHFCLLEHGLLIFKSAAAENISILSVAHVHCILLI